MAPAIRAEPVASETSRDRASVFVSYAREEHELVERLASALRGNGREVWVDTDDIRATDEWERAIDAGIDSSDAVAFVLSPAFARSKQCRRELDYAVGSGKRLVPLLAEDVDAADIAPELARLNWITISSDAAAVSAIEEALDTDLVWLRAHTDLHVRAIGWEARSGDRALLLRGRPLAEAERFLGTTGKEPAPTALQTRYVIAGRRAAIRRQRGAIAAVTTFLFVAVALALVALLQRNRAVHQANVARSREIAASSAAIATSDPDLARLLAIEAMKTEHTPEATAALRRAVAQPALRARTDPKTHVVGLSPGGGRIALSASDGRLAVRDLASGRRLAAERPVVGGRGAVAFAPAGRRLAFTTTTGSGILWDLQRGVSRPLKGPISALEFSPDGSSLLLLSRGGSVVIVDAGSGKPRVTLPAHAGESSPFPSVATATFAPRGDLVATWNEHSSEAHIWDARNGTLQSTLRHGARITDAAISPDAKVALTAGRDMTVRFWDAKTGMSRRPTLRVPPAADDAFDVAIASASFSQQSSAHVTTLTQDHLQVWDTRNGKLLLNLPSRFNYRIDAGFGPTEPYLLTGSGVYDWVHNRNVANPPMGVTRINAHGSFESVELLGDQSTRVWSGLVESTLIALHRKAAEVSAAGGRAAIAYTDGTAEIRDLRTARLLLRVPGTPAAAFGVALSPDASTLAVERPTGVEIWSTGRRKRQTLIKSVRAAVGFSANGSRLLAFARAGSGAFAVVDTTTGHPIGKPFPLRTVLIDSAALSPDGQLFLEPTAENTVDVFRVADGHRARSLHGHTNLVADVAVSPDSKLAATGGFDGLAIMWDLQSGKRVATLRAHEGTVTRVAFSANGRWLLTRSTDGSLRVWDARTGAPVETWTELPKGLPSASEVDAPPLPDLGLDFSATNNELVRADDTYVYRIPCPACADPEELLARARTEVRRTLTPVERRQYLHESG